MSKKYITENAAIKILAEAGIEVTTEHMSEFAELGVIPAYMKFKPTDKVLYPGNAFHLVDMGVVVEAGPGELTTMEGGEQDEWQVLPFPLTKSGSLKLTGGFTYGYGETEVIEEIHWRVYVARNDNILDRVSEEHFVRVYAPQEVRQSTKNVQSYLDGNGHKPMKHSCCETWKNGEIYVDTKGWFTSPFSEDADAIAFKKRIRKNVSSSSSDLPGKDMPCMRLVVAAMRELVDELHHELGKRPYTNGELINKLQKIMPEKDYRGMGEDSLKRSFWSANLARDYELKRGGSLGESETPQT